MKFQAFREYRPSDVPSGDANEVRSIVDYLKIDLPSFLKDWATGFLHINFEDNFQQFKFTVSPNAAGDIDELAPGEEIAIPNEFRPVIPKYRLIVRGNEYASYVQDSETKWTQDFLYLKNYGTGAATFTVIFLK